MGMEQTGGLPVPAGAIGAGALTWEGLKPSSRAVVAELLLHGPLSRAELARRLGYSGASLTKLSTPLLADGIIVDGPTWSLSAQPARRGRRSLPLDVAVETYPIIGIKLTGEELFAVRTDLRATINEELHSQLRGPTPDEVVDAIVRAVTSLDPTGLVRRVGISLAGNIRVGDDHVHRSMFLGWDDVPLAELVRKRIGREVVLANDVRALAAAQHWFGAAKGSECFAVLTVGAGVGCALATHNGIMAGNGGQAGLIAHLPIKEGGPLCDRGHRGCASSYLSLDGILRTIQLVSGDRVRDLDDCLELAADGYPPAVAVFSDACYALGVLVAHVVNLIGPDRVILSGEGIVICDLNPGALQEGIASGVDDDAAGFEVIVRPFNFMEWSRGAAVIAIQSLIRPPGFIIH